MYNIHLHEIPKNIIIVFYISRSYGKIQVVVI